MNARCAPALAVALAAALGPAMARAGECPGPTLSTSAAPPSASPWMDASLPPERRTELLLAQMTLEEKIDLATGEPCLVYGFYGAPIIDHSDEHDLALRSAKVHLVAGERHDLRVDYSADSPDIGVKVDLGGDVKLGWEVPPGTVMPAAREAASLAAASDVAIVIMRDYGTEERDRPGLALPNDQDELVRAVAAANPPTIVVLTTGQPSAMPWLDAVPAVLEAWYAGQEQGNAIARILFGDVNPSGKLPITFPRTLEETPFGASAATDGGAVSYSEGVLVGYRWYDATGVEPLFPFGFGLSYTTFRYDGLEVEAGATARDGSEPARGRVAFTITNTGARAGAEVAQVYLGSCGGEGAGDVASPPRQLAGFAKVRLAPGESARVAVEVAPEALSCWNPAAHAWEIPSCELAVEIGSSSRDVRLGGSLAVSADGTIAPAAPAASSGGCRQGSGGGAPSLVALLLALLARRAERRRRA